MAKRRCKPGKRERAIAKAVKARIARSEGLLNEYELRSMWRSARYGGYVIPRRLHANMFET